MRGLWGLGFQVRGLGSRFSVWGEGLPAQGLRMMIKEVELLITPTTVDL